MLEIFAEEMKECDITPFDYVPPVQVLFPPCSASSSTPPHASHALHGERGVHREHAPHALLRVHENGSKAIRRNDSFSLQSFALELEQKS